MQHVYCQHSTWFLVGIHIDKLIMISTENVASEFSHLLGCMFGEIVDVIVTV